ncbi:MAG: hypothetical protein EOP22_18575 [Hyphomicrobiales bacterium]|nr:MAG: hypothetical protein EOP22_18575 [Hyphomicrobiales bacterium]
MLPLRHPREGGDPGATTIVLTALDSRLRGNDVVGATRRGVLDRPHHRYAVPLPRCTGEDRCRQRPRGPDLTASTAWISVLGGGRGRRFRRRCGCW